MIKPEIKKIVRLSWVKERAAKDFEEMKRDPQLDPMFFNDQELEHYIGVLIRTHADEWMVIDDLGDEGAF